MGSGLSDTTHLIKEAPAHAHESQQKPSSGAVRGIQMVSKRDFEMKTKENAAALAVFSSRTVTRRACGGRSTNGGVFAPPTSKLHSKPFLYTWTADRCPRTDCIPVSDHL